jgi:hypothetical protein
MVMNSVVAVGLSVGPYRIAQLPLNGLSEQYSNWEPLKKIAEEKFSLYISQKQRLLFIKNKRKFATNLARIIIGNKTVP